VRNPLPVCVPYETLNLIGTPLPSRGVKDLPSDSAETTPHRLCCVRNPLPVCVPYETLNLIGTPLPLRAGEYFRYLVAVSPRCPSIMIAPTPSRNNCRSSRELNRWLTGKDTSVKNCSRGLVENTMPG